MIEFSGRCVLLDIEGTTSSVRFVYDVMFPYARRHVDSYLQAHWDAPAVQSALDQMARDAGWPDRQSWLACCTGDVRQWVVAHVLRLMDEDAKTTGLKALQGLVWESGFRSGQLKAHVYDDVPPALARWHQQGIDIRIYSSGSIHAQRLFFGHTIYGNLLGYIRGHYDTTTGSKRDVTSYKAIAQDIPCEPRQVLFLSDVPAELDAARAAGMATALCRRPENAPCQAQGHPEFVSFAEIGFPTHNL